MRHYSIDDVLVRVPPALESDEAEWAAANPDAHRSVCHRALGDGEETVTITEFSNGDGSLAAPRNCARKRTLDSGADSWEGDSRSTRGWG